MILFTDRKIINTQCLHNNYQGLISLLLFIPISALYTYFVLTFLWLLFKYLFLRVRGREYHKMALVSLGCKTAI